MIRIVVSHRRRVRYCLLGAVPLVLAATLAACGGTTHTVVTVVKAAPKKTPSVGYRMSPASTPTACIDYLSGRDAEVEFVSLDYDVTPACQSWTRNNAKQGSLWTEQRPEIIPVTQLSQVCALSNYGGTVTASVVDDGSQASSQAACDGLIAAGWASAPAPGAVSFKNAKATGTTQFLIPQSPNGKYPRIEPSALYFSADAGNIVTGITWTQWSDSEAKGQGSSTLQSCEPNCAEGAQVPANASITLVDPVDGHFTELLEERNGITSIAYYSAKTGSDNPAIGFWPIQAS